MQLDVGSEPYLSTAQALCLFSNHTFYYKTFANWQRITAMAKSEFFAYAPIKALCCGEDFYFLECNWYFLHMLLERLYAVGKFQTLTYNTFRDMN